MACQKNSAGPLIRAISLLAHQEGVSEPNTTRERVSPGQRIAPGFTSEGHS